MSVASVNRFGAGDVASVGWLSALSDRQIGTAMSAMHSDLTSNWTLHELAKTAGMSRSAFAVKFKQLVGLTPLAYLTRWKMLVAADRLRHRGETVTRIADTLGYESETAFRTAFKRVMSLSPKQYQSELVLRSGFGITTMRFAPSSESMERSSKQFLIETLATAIQACIDGQGSEGKISSESNREIQFRQFSERVYVVSDNTGGHMQPTLTEQIRTFNRFYTREIGLLDEHLPASDFTLAEARVLYELAQLREPTAADIIRSLGMDKAHVSRIVARFQEAGLLRSRISTVHGKHKLLSLTPSGKKAFQRLNAGANSHIAALIAPLSDIHRKRLSEHMLEIQKLFAAKTVSAQDVQLRPLKAGDLGWITHRQAVLYQQEYGWDWTYEGLVAKILGDFAANFDKSREDAWVAELDGSVVGSVFLMKAQEEQVAKLRLLYVEPSARGLGVGSRLVKQCVERARELGYARLTLWTNDILISARRIYQSVGFTLLAEDRHHSFGKDLVGQTWGLDLKET